MSNREREQLKQLVNLLHLSLEHGQADALSAKESLRLVPYLEALLKSVMDITDVEIIIATDMDTIQE